MAVTDATQISASRTISLRRLLALLLAGMLAYVALIALVIAVSVAPAARVLGRSGAVATGVQRALSVHLDRLSEARARASTFVRPLSDGALPSADARRRLMEEVQQDLDTAFAVRASIALRDVPADVRVRLGDAADAEMRSGSALLSSLAAADAGAFSEARRAYDRADSLSRIAVREMNAAQIAMVEDLAQREANLAKRARVASVAVVVWVLIGLVSLPFLYLVLRHRLYDPLESLQGALGRVAGGELTATVPVRRDDELGRVSALFNRMTSELQTRAVEERRERAEAVLRASEARYRAAFEDAGVGMAELSLDGRFIHINRQLAQTLGYEEQQLANRSVVDVTLADDLGEVQALLAHDWTHGARTLRQTIRYVHRDGTTVWGNVTTAAMRGDDGAMSYLLSIVEDITEQHRLESQLRQSQKLESLGQLAGGVAHDFNNLLTAILSYAEFARLNAPPDSEIAADVDQVVLAARRAADLTRQLLAFARKQLLQPRLVNLNELARGTDRMLRRLIGEHIALQTRLDPELEPVLIDPGQFEQVLVNLVVNARDAMPHGGTLTVETRQLTFASETVVGDQQLAPGRYAMIAVRDTGEGMSEQTLARVFEPFFTTKESGRGTGLGLSTCYGIVAQAGGQIAVQSRLGMGSTFRVYLPSAQGSAENSGAVAAPMPRGSETILLAEDDLAVRELAERTLRACGYTVLAAPNGADAYDLARGSKRPIDLLLSDVVMPGLSGPRLGQQLVRERPKLRVILMSGYADDPMAADTAREIAQSVLAKPFTPSQLAVLVRETLDRTPV